MTEDDLSAAASLVMMIILETFEIGLNKYTRKKKKDYFNPWIQDFLFWGSTVDIGSKQINKVKNFHEREDGKSQNMKKLKKCRNVTIESLPLTP